MTTSTQNWRRNDSEDRGANADFDDDANVADDDFDDDANVAADDFDDLFSGLTTTLNITDWTLMGKLRTPSSVGGKGNDTGGRISLLTLSH